MAAADDQPVDQDDAAATPSPTEMLHGVVVTTTHGQRVLHPGRDELVSLVRDLHTDGYLQLLDLTAVDYLSHPGRTDLPPDVHPERFELVVTLLSHAERERLRLRVQLPAADLTVSTLTDVHPSADALEREVWDLFGITFEGHLDLSRILLPEDWDGHPLRKDHAVGRVPVQFKGVAPSR